MYSFHILRTAFTKVLQRVAEAENRFSGRDIPNMFCLSTIDTLRVDATSQRIVGLGDKKLTLLEGNIRKSLRLCGKHPSYTVSRVGDSAAERHLARVIEVSQLYARGCSAVGGPL